MSVKGWGAAVKKVVRIKKAMESGPQEAAKAWIEQDFKPYAQTIAPRLTGEFADSIDGRTSPTSVTVFATAPHSRHVEEGTSTHVAQPTVGPATYNTLPQLRLRIDQAIKRRLK